MPNKLYFAYGSNLNENDWNDSPYTNVPFLEALEERSDAYLPDYKLAFTRYSTGRKGGVLDVVPALGHVVPGQIYEIQSSAAKQNLDSKEGAPTCYREVENIVLIEGGEQTSVITYEVVNKQEFVEPHIDYVKVVEDGLKSLGLPTEHLFAAARNEPMPFLIDSFFCYGTLRKGECRYGVMEKFGIVSETPAEINGLLYDCNSYPGAVLESEESENRVVGELLQVRDVAEAVKELDAIEGFYGFGEPGSLFRRQIVSVTLPSGKTRLAWVYDYAMLSDEPLIKSGDWLSRSGKRC
jgi:gamma-glutamylcyclotransferase (GGCT)/AIG2-like uncharacterized protein YtfP